MSGDKKRDQEHELLEEKIEHREDRTYTRYVPTSDELDDDNPPTDDSDEAEAD